MISMISPEVSQNLQKNQAASLKNFVENEEKAIWAIS